MTIVDLFETFDALQDNPPLDLETRADPEDISHIPTNDALNLYFRQMASEPLLDAEQEKYLARLVACGRQAEELLGEASFRHAAKLQMIADTGRRAYRQFARANTRLVISISKRYRNQGLPFADLIQEGNIGLLTAIEKFDPDLGNRFSTYASWWIRQSVRRAILQKADTIRLPLHLADELRRVQAIQRDLAQELQRQPTSDEIAERLALSPEDVEDVLEAQLNMLALEKPVGDEDEDELGAFIEDETLPDLDVLVHERSMTSDVMAFVREHLSPRHAEILRLRFGLNGAAEQTLEQVGKVMNLSRERIRQLQNEALRTLRHPRHHQHLQQLSI